MKKVRKSALILIGLFSLVVFSLLGCSNDIKKYHLLSEEPYIVLRPSIDSSALRTTECRMLRDRSEYTLYQAWFENNQNGWENSIASYTNGRIQLETSQYRLLVFEKSVVLSFHDDKGKAHQMTKEIDSHELDYLYNVCD